MCQTKVLLPMSRYVFFAQVCFRHTYQTRSSLKVEIGCDILYLCNQQLPTVSPDTKYLLIEANHMQYEQLSSHVHI